MQISEKVTRLKADFDGVYKSGMENSENYKSGYADGKQEGYTEGKVDGIEQGKQAEYDAFWDAYQEKGNRANYSYAFAIGWDNEIFKPKYDIIPTSAMNMFYTSRITGDLVELCERQGVVLDFSKATNLNYLFGDGYQSRIGVVDVRAASNSTVGLFYFAKCETIDKIILKSDGSSTFTSWFDYTYDIINVNFEGVIGQSGLNLQWSTKLSKASIISVIDHLSKETSGLSITFSKAAVDREFEEGDRLGSDSQEWEEILQNHSNCTISLI